MRSHLFKLTKIDAGTIDAIKIELTYDERLAIVVESVPQQQRENGEDRDVQLTKVSDFNAATELWKLEGLIGSSSNRELFLSRKPGTLAKRFSETNNDC